MTSGRSETFAEVLNAAVADMVANGFDSAERVAGWMDRIRRAAEASLTPPYVLEAALQEAMRSIYRRMVDGGAILKLNPGVSRFTLDKVKPRLRAELDRRIMASANLIKLNRGAAIEKTLQRFSGWSTSIPAGGTRAADRRQVKRDVRRSLAQLPFVERRVLIDQGHKFTAALSETLARDGGAIAATWRSRWRQAGYDYREDHKERDGQVYAVRGCWALERGLMRAGPAGFTDQITQPASEIFCRCAYQWLHNLRDLPDEMLTAKGKAELARVKVA
jgi:hypothetical protein